MHPTVAKRRGHLTQYTLQRLSAVPRKSTVYFVALAFHLIQLVQGIHGVMSEPITVFRLPALLLGVALNYCPCCRFSADNTFLTPTGPTLLIVRHILSVKPGKSLPGRFPSTHITKYCLSIWTFSFTPDLWEIKQPTLPISLISCYDYYWWRRLESNQ